MERRREDHGRDRHDSRRDRERDRDSRRPRSSVSPQRLTSPSPPPKRGRRTSEYGYGRCSSGSPRNGAFVEDRRYAYDGSKDSGDDRSNGRAHSGFANGHGGLSQREGLMTYKQFIAELEDDILPAEAERRYKEYKTEYISTIKRSFFERNKDEDWLREKYDPACLEAVIQRRNENCKASFKEFMGALEGGTLDITAPVFGSRVSLSSKEDLKTEGEAYESSKRKGSDHGFSKDQENGNTPKAHPFSSNPKRIASDIEQARALIRKLDGEKGIEVNILAESSNDQQKDGNLLADSGSMKPIVIVRSTNQVKGYEGMELLDVMLMYLWHTHSVDYYGMVELKEQSKGPRHVRVEGKGNEDMEAALEWQRKLDSFWQSRLQGQDLLQVLLGKEKLDAILVEALDTFVRKIRDEKYGWKYGCGAQGCTKLFHGPEFVQKHLKLKHPEIVKDIVAKAQEELYFQNYMSDPNAPAGTPTILSQPASRDRSNRHHAISRGGSRDTERAERDDRGGVRERERYRRPYENGRYDRQKDHSPSHNYPRPGYEGRDSVVPFEDFTAFDPSAGPAMRGLPPFPPQVLMPVPGAGPLGPFVPAPREVAMRAVREQGGAFDRETSGASRGPFLIPPLNLDPRQVRSYHDLDAPEDEVHVFDYRSL